LTTKNQLILKELQNAEAAAGGQSYLGWTLDQLKSMTQLYSEFMERGLVNQDYFTGIGLGSNKAEQSSNLYHMAIPDFNRS